jgi:isopentenyldiphosphate isomerase
LKQFLEPAYVEQHPVIGQPSDKAFIQKLQNELGVYIRDSDIFSLSFSVYRNPATFDLLDLHG